MSAFGQPERATQNRVIALFRVELGYRYLGDWTDQNRLDERLDETRAAIVQSHAVFTKTCSFSWKIFPTIDMQSIEKMHFPWCMAVARGWALTKGDFMAEFGEVDIHQLLFKPSRSSTT